MAYSFLLHTLRGFVAVVLLLQSRPVFRSSTLCPQEHCIYFPVTNNPAVVTINEIKFGGLDKGGGTGFSFGEVINNGNVPVYNAVVQVTFICYLQCSSYSSSFTNTTFLTATLPSQMNAFEVYPIERYVIISDAKVISWTTTPTLPLANLSVVASHAYTVSYDGPTGYPTFYAIVTGTLRNDMSNRLKDVQVYVWNVKKTISYRQVISQVSSGDTIAFSATLFEEVRPTDTIRIVAQGVVSP